GARGRGLRGRRGRVGRGGVRPARDDPGRRRPARPDAARRRWPGRLPHPPGPRRPADHHRLGTGGLGGRDRGAGGGRGRLRHEAAGRERARRPHPGAPAPQAPRRRGPQVARGRRDRDLPGRGGRASGRDAGAPDPHRVPPAGRARRRRGPGRDPGGAAEAGVGIRLLRRHPPAGRPHPAAAAQGRAGPGRPGVRAHRARARVQGERHRVGRVQIVPLMLRRRVATAFGLGSLLLTGVLAAATWNLAGDYMLRQREQSAVRQAEVNALLGAISLRSGSEGLGELLAGLTSDSPTSVLLQRPGGWITSGRRIDPTVLPDDLMDEASAGVPASRRLDVDRVPVMAVAVPTGGGSDVFVQLFPLLMQSRSRCFFAVVRVDGVAPSAFFGFGRGAWASRRPLRPLAELTAAASRVASGELHTRLPQYRDRDLAALATAFNDTTEALEARVRRDARFAGDVSHELRSPLTTMTNAAAVLRRRRAELTGAAGQALDLLLSEVARFERMVVDLLEISRDHQQADGPTGEI